MSASLKRALTIFLVVYVVGIAVGLVLFRSPNVSSAYLAQYGADHQRYHHILKSEEYRAYEERPALHVLPPELRDEIAFVESYVARPEYQAEHNRIAGYVWYFRVFNSFYFIALIVTFARRPLRDFLDGRIAEIQGGFDAAHQDAAEGATVQASAQAELDRWQEVEQTIRHHADDVLDDEVTAIREEFKNTRRQLYNSTMDRKSAEYLRVARTLQLELVEKAIAELKGRYTRESDAERLAQNVDQFVRTMDTFS